MVALALVSALLVLTTRGGRADEQRPLRFPRTLRDVVPVGASLPGIAFGLSSYGYGTVAALLVLHLQVDHLGGDSVALAVFALSSC